ncbi:hypothetical protein [Anaerovibrio slackiae]|uniref:hypothetical protein n=1 Tax=Anaerovibrio slackiae TaxID=2652309 RepID=UPI00386C2E63
MIASASSIPSLPLKKHMPYAKINSAYLDSAHDAMAIHKYFHKEKIHAYIDFAGLQNRISGRDFILIKISAPYALPNIECTENEMTISVCA